MLFKMKWMVCLSALAIACAAQAQDKAATTQDQTKGSQAGKAQSQTDKPATSEDQNRRDAKSTTSETRESRTGEARSGEDRIRNRDVNVQRTETREYRSGASSDKPLDAHLAACLLLGNQKEVAISQWAAERAKNEKVKAFAKQMVKDHSQAITMLQRFAGPDASKDLSIEQSTTNRSDTTVRRSATSTDTNRSQEGERRDSANSSSPNRDTKNPNRSSDSDGARNPTRDSSARSADATARSSTDSSSQVTATTNQDRNVNESDRNRSVTSVQVRSEHEAMPDKLQAIEREVAQKCIAMAKQELEQSTNFDQAYVGLAISEHVGMIAKLETFKSYASQDLGKVIQESLETAQGHLRHAKELVTEIGHSSSSGSSTNVRSDASSRSETSTKSDSTSRTDTNRSDASNRDTNRNPATRDDASRKEGAAYKKDAPKS